MSDTTLKDNQILHELDLNSRESLAIIAKNKNINKQTVHYKFHQLIDNGTINKTLAVIDFSKLGYSAYKCFISLHQLNRDKNNEIIKYLKEHTKVYYLSNTDGKFNLAITFLVKSPNEMSRYIDQFNEKYSSYIKFLDIVTVIKGEYFVRDYLLGYKTRKNKKPIEFGSIENSPSTIKIDEIDIHILKSLASDARARATEIAKYTKITADAVSFRIKKLEEKKIIKNYILLLNSEKMNLNLFSLYLTLQNTNQTKEKKLKKYLIDNPHVLFINKTLGPWNMEIQFEVKSNQDFRDMLMDIKDEFGAMIKDYFVLNIYQVHKYNFFPFENSN